MSEMENVSNLIEMMTIEILKVSNLEHKKVEEHKKVKPDNEKIARWDKASRAANEKKASLKNRIDIRIKEAIEKREYNFIGVVRDF